MDVPLRFYMASVCVDRLSGVNGDLCVRVTIIVNDKVVDRRCIIAYGDVTTTIDIVLN